MLSCLPVFDRNIFPNDICATENNQEYNEEKEYVKPLTRNQRHVTELQDIVSNKPYVLDVDLDFFSTANPFKNMLRQDEEQALRRLYRYPTVIDFSDEVSQYDIIMYPQFTVIFL